MANVEKKSCQCKSKIELDNLTKQIYSLTFRRCPVFGDNNIKDVSVHLMNIEKELKYLLDWVFERSDDVKRLKERLEKYEPAKESKHKQKEPVTRYLKIL